MKARLKTMAFGLVVGLALLSLPMGGDAATSMPSAAGSIQGPQDASAGEDPAVERYAIQVAAFKDEYRAQKKMTQLAAAGYRAFYRHEDTGAKGMWYRVYAGSYATQTEAREAGARLKGEGVIDWYTLRRIDASADPHLGRAGLPSEKIPVAPRPQASAPHPDIHTVGKLPAAVERADAETTLDTGRPAGDPNASSPAQLSLLDAFLYSMEGNREIAVVAFTPQQAREEVVAAESVYDPSIFSEASYRRDPNLESSVRDIVTEDNGVTQAGIRKPLTTGGRISTYMETRYSDLNNSEFRRRYKHIVSPTVELRQPLLKNIGSQQEKTAIKVANYQAHISEEEFREKVIDVVSRVGKAYWKLYLARELIVVNRENLDMAEEIERRERERLGRGISQPLDVERARSNVASRRRTLLKSREEYLIAMDRLKLMLNWGPFRIGSDLEVIPIEIPLTTPLDVVEAQAIEAALDNRPEVLMAKQRQKIRQADVELAAHQRLPELEAFGRYSMSGYGGDFGDAIDDIGPNDEDIWEVGVNFEWPIGNRAANSRYHQKVLRHKQMDAMVERIEDDIRLDIRQILHGIATARGEIQTTRLAREAARKVVEGEFVRFEIGQTSNEELLRAQDLLALTNRNYSRAVVDYNIALNELVRAQGILPDGIHIEGARR